MELRNSGVRSVLLEVEMAILLLAVAPASAQIYQLKEMNTQQIRALDLAKTVVIIPGGILEQHGPYLPSYSDGYVNEYLSDRVAEAIVGRPGWTVLMFPTIPLGAGGGNQVGKKSVFPGTYHVHFSTLRAVFLDLASELGEAGFRWIFVIHGHGALRHQQALDQAADYFGDIYQGKMVHLSGLRPSSPTARNLSLTDTEQRENGLDVHAGMSETSQLLFLRPTLLQPSYQEALAEPGSSWRELVDRGMRAEWPGYFGSPRLAQAWRGREILRARTQDLSDLALRILDGFDHHTLQRSADQQLTDEAIGDYNDAADEHDRFIAQKQAEWLRGKGLQ